MKTRMFMGLAAPMVLFAGSAFADGTAACLDAVSKGQTLRDAHKLVEARAQLRVCAAAQCPAVVQRDCAAWLADVEKATPTIVVTAMTGTGTNVFDATVTVDGKPFADTLDGRGVAIDPGSHALRLVLKDGTTRDQQIVITEGEQNQRVTVTLAAPASGAGTTGSSTVDGGTTAGASPWKTAGWVLGGLGVIGLGIGTAFGVMAISDNNSWLHCDANNECQPSPLSNARSAATGSRT